MTKNEKTITFSLELNSDGTVDIDATVDTFRDTIILMVDEEAEQREATIQAVDKVLELAQGKLAMDMLVGMVLSKLQVTPENYRRDSVRVRNFIKDNLGEKGSNSLYASAKGKGGGVYCNVQEVETLENEESLDNEESFESEDDLNQVA